METLFTWVHLSDLHVRAPREDGPVPGDRVLAALRHDLEAHAGERVDAILVTGDVAWSGQREEYVAADAFLVHAARVFGLGPERVFVVAGNHDIDRSEGRAALTAKLVAELRQGRRRLDAALEHGRAREVLASRLYAFAVFAATFGPPPVDDGAPPEEVLWWSHPVEGRGGLRVRIVGLCTSFLAEGDAGRHPSESAARTAPDRTSDLATTQASSDRGVLRLGERQLRDAASTIAPGELVIALSHHPARGGWLADERDTEVWLREHAHVHVSGHPHDPIAEEARSGSPGPFVWIAAGASPPKRKLGLGAERRLGYSITSVTRVDDGTLALHVAPRCWSPEAGAFVRDERHVPGGESAAQRPLRLMLPPRAPPTSPPPAPSEPPPEPILTLSEPILARSEPILARQEPIPEKPSVPVARARPVSAAQAESRDRELREIFAAVEQRAARGDAEGAWEVLAPVIASLERHEHHADFVTAGRRVLRIAREDGPIAAAALAALGRSLASLGDLAGARENLARSLAVAEAHGFRDTEALALGGLGRVLGMLGDLDRAAAHHRRAGALHEKLGLRRRFAADLGNLGLVLRRQGKVGDAVNHLTRALAIHEELGEREARAEILGGLGLCFRDRGELASAIDHFRSALAIHEELGRLAGQATMLGNLGNTYRALGEIGRAVEHLERALAIYEELGLPEGQAAALGNLGACHRARGELPAARERYERALAIFRRLGLPDEHLHVRTVLSALAQLRGPRA